MSAQDKNAKKNVKKKKTKYYEMKKGEKLLKGRQRRKREDEE